MKQSKKTNKDIKSKKKHKLSAIRIFFMNKLKAWCNEPSTRESKTARKKEIAKILEKDVQTLKNMYLYGQGSLDDWFKAMDYINALKQETIIQLYDSYPYIENKLNSLSQEELKLHRHVSEMSEAELALINKLIDAGLKVNKAIRKS